MRLDAARGVLPLIADATPVLQQGVLDYGSSNFLNLSDFAT